MTKLEKFVTEGNEKADELAKSGALLDEGFVAEAGAEAMKQEREEVYVALQYAASFHCLVEAWKDCEVLKPKPKEKWSFVDRKSEGTKHQTEWCANSCQKVGENGEGAIWEVMTWLEGMDRQDEVF